MRLLWYGWTLTVSDFGTFVVAVWSCLANSFRYAAATLYEWLGGTSSAYVGQQLAQCHEVARAASLVQGSQPATKSTEGADIVGTATIINENSVSRRHKRACDQGQASSHERPGADAPVSPRVYKHFLIGEDMHNALVNGMLAIRSKLAEGNPKLEKAISMSDLCAHVRQLQAVKSLPVEMYSLLSDMVGIPQSFPKMDQLVHCDPDKSHPPKSYFWMHLAWVWVDSRRR
jgi:hypothetical protein